MSTTVEQRLKRVDRAKKNKGSFDETYKDAMRYSCQHRETFDYHTNGEKKNDRIFDSTAQDATQKFVSNLQSGLVPPFKKWAKLVPGADIPQENMDKATAQLEAITDAMFKYIHSSNFDIAISESFTDLSIGTGALLVNEGDDENPLNFVAAPLAEVIPERGPHGIIKTCFRDFRMPWRNIELTWEDAKLPKDYNEKKDADEDVDLLESTIYNPDSGKYEYYVDVVKTKTNIYKEIMPSSPWVIFRWSAMPGEVMGRGPMLNALADVKTINKCSEFLLKSAALRTVPTFVVADDGVVNPHNIVIEPGAIIPSAPFGPGGSPIQALQVGGDMNLSQFVLERMQTRIENMMFTNPLGDVNLPVKTATEMSLRAQDLANRIGSAYGRLNYELMGPLISRVLYILNKRGLLPVDLRDVKVNGRMIKISHQSPIAQAQDEEELINAVRYVETLGRLLGPQAAMLFTNVEGFSKLLGDNLGVSSKMIPTQEQRKAAMAIISQLAIGSQQQQALSAPAA